MTDWIADGEDGANVRAKLNGITNRGALEEVTSGASPVVCDPDATLTLVTSGGTHGVEIIELDDLVFTLDSFARPENYGFRHVIALKVQTENDDVVKVRLNSGSAILVKDKIGNVLAEIADDLVVLDYVGATAVFEWGGEQWYLNHEDNNTSTNFIGKSIPLPSLPSVGRNAVLAASNSGASFSALPIPGLTRSVVTGASPTELSYEEYSSRITTGGTGGVEIVVMQNGNIGRIGARHLIRLDALTNPADSVSLDVAYVRDIDGNPVTSVILQNFVGNIGDYVLLEAWEDDYHRILRGTATVI